ncbi:class I SAM-dependent methyltransferase [Leptospira yasudae]|uniref:class I SAM-dependent methyltransferase n=1 Tax=Leptospira yasudae TaxID=2202201 RepID=UPI00108399E8|nr:class I SAM-dependent methyltransferase [Leptospira yasudae]TGK24544.1 class I SAM-dependent methyltransferase [Leptospira yasudae]TGM05670.1 class I SAM-dependent methyltransferase [Leptospira yasudae]
MDLNNEQILCRLCGSGATADFHTTLLNRYEVTYYKCQECELIQSEIPFWLQEAYEKAISILDTGIFQRNNDNVKKLTVLLTEIQSQLFQSKNRLKGFLKSRLPFQGKILDYGGGHGVLVRLLRDVGFDCYWYDKYATNDFAGGFEFGANENYDIVLAFELFEHFENPKESVNEILALAKPKILIFSTLLYGNTTPPKDWWYYAFEAGQHIAFYNTKTLQKIASLHGYYAFSLVEDLHFLVRKDVKLNFMRLKRRLQRLDMEFLKAKSLYRSKTIEDHNLLKKKIVETFHQD